MAAPTPDYAPRTACSPARPCWSPRPPAPASASRPPSAAPRRARSVISDDPRAAARRGRRAARRGHRRHACGGVVRRHRRGRRARRCSTARSTSSAHIDVLVNNAGLGGTANLVDMTDDQWNMVLDVTLNGTFRCTRAALPHMYARGAGRDRQQRLGARLARPGRPGALRRREGGVMALTRCAAIEAAAHGVRVNAVAPSLAMHPFLAKVTTDELLERARAARGVRTRRRAVGGRQRHRLPRQRLLHLHDRRGRVGLEPAPLSGRERRVRGGVIRSTVAGTAASP